MFGVTWRNYAALKGRFVVPLMPLRSKLYTNTAYLWFGEAAFDLLGFAFWAVAARLYPPEVVGLGGTAITSLVFLAQVAQFGLGYVFIRHLHQAQDGPDRLLGRSLAGTAVTSLLSGLILLGSLPLWSHDLRELLWRSPGYAGAYLLFVVFNTIWALLNFIFIAYRRSVFVMSQRLIAGVLRIPLVVLLSGMGSAFGVLAGHGLAILVGTFLVALFFLPRCTGKLYPPLALDLWRLAPLVPFALSSLASHVLTVLAWQLLPLAIIALAGAEAAGFFYVAWAVSGIPLIMARHLALVLFAEGSHDMQGFWTQAWSAMAVGAALGGLFAVLAYFLGDVVLLPFGRDYIEESSTLLKLLTAATPMAAVTHVYLSIERVRQRLVSLVAVSLIVTIVMLGTIAVLVPSIGIVGAGYGVVAGYGVGALLSLLLLYPMMKRSHHLVSTSQSTAR
jgi:O-antigen/teichoic acid export membrane protein